MEPTLYDIIERFLDFDRTKNYFDVLTIPVEYDETIDPSVSWLPIPDKYMKPLSDTVHKVLDYHATLDDYAVPDDGSIIESIAYKYNFSHEFTRATVIMEIDYVPDGQEWNVTSRLDSTNAKALIAEINRQN